MALKLNRSVAGYVVLALGMVLAQGMAFNARAETRRQACKAVVADRELLRDVVNVAIPPLTAAQPGLDPTLPPSVRQLILDSRTRSRIVRARIEKRLERHLELCNNTGVDEVVRLGPAPTSSTSSSSSTPPSSTTTTVVGSTIPQAQPRPPLRSTSSTAAPVTSTSAPTTTTTTSCPRLIPLVGPCTP